jgi:hypothetical protein
MDFLDPNKKRINKFKLFFGYFLVAIAISMGALVLLFAVSGYGFDHGEVYKKGLVFFDSRPPSANVVVRRIDSKDEQIAKTDTRMELKEGRYKVEISKDNYRTWQREFNVEGGLVERMVYPFLFPNELTTVNLKAYKSMPQVVSSSPSRQWLVIMNPEKFGSFDVYLANEPEKPPTSFTIPSDLLSKAKNHKLEVIEWANDNDNFLCKHTYDKKIEFVLINRNKPTESININQLTNQKPYDVSLKDKKINELFMRTSKGGLLELVNVKTRVLTPISSKVIEYKSHGDDMIAYVSPGSKKSDTVKVKIKTKDKEYNLRDLPTNSNYVIDIARFDNNWFLIVGASSEDRVYIYKNPLEFLSTNSNKTLFARTLKINNPKYVSFSANARNIAVQSGQNFAVYDAEYDKQYHYKIQDKIANKKAEWMDGHRLITNVDNTVLVFDYDGINMQKLMANDASVDIAFDRDYDYGFAVSTSSDKRANLTQTRLFVTD